MEIKAGQSWILIYILYKNINIYYKIHLLPYCCLLSTDRTTIEKETVARRKGSLHGMKTELLQKETAKINEKGKKGVTHLFSLIFCWFSWYFGVAPNFFSNATWDVEGDWYLDKTSREKKKRRVGKRVKKEKVVKRLGALV